MFKKNFLYALFFWIIYNHSAFTADLRDSGVYTEADSLIVIKIDDPDGSQQFFKNRKNISINDDLSLTQALTTWFDKDLFNPVTPPSSCKNYVINVIGYCSGLSRGSLYFKFGYDLANRMVHFSRAANIAVSSIYGLGVAAPMTILGLESSGDFIRNMLKEKSDYEKDIEQSSQKCQDLCIKIVGKPPLAVISVISSATVTYLTYYEFNGILGWFWLVPGIPNLYTRSAMDYLAIPTVAKAIYDEIKRPIDRFVGQWYPGSRRDNITYVKDKLTEAENYISSFTEEQAQAFLTLFNDTKDTMTKLTMLVKPQLFEEMTQVREKNTWGRKIVSTMGGAIGVIGLWIYLPPTEEAFTTLLTPICSYFSTQCSQDLIDGFTYTALLSATSIMSLSSASSFSKFYDSVRYVFSRDQSSVEENEENRRAQRNKSIKRGAAAGASAFLAAWNTSQSVEVALSFLDMNRLSSRFALTAALVSSFSLAFWAVDEKFLKYLESSDPRTPLLNKLNVIVNKIDDMGDEHLLSLRTFLTT